MSRWASRLAVLLALQGVLLAAYLLVERQRQAERPLAVERFPDPEPAPALVVERAGSREPVPQGPHLVHFWATWCGPCQAELPELLAAARAEAVPVLAVTAEDWSTVARWFGGTVPAEVVRDPSGAAAQDWRVSGLPDTFVVADGRLVARMGGPRDWRSPAARRYLREVAR